MCPTSLEGPESSLPAAREGRTVAVPRAHQAEALSAVAHALEQGSRATISLACGAGKTLVGLWAAEMLGVRAAVVLVPTLSLMRQTLLEWGANSRYGFDAVCVCADETVGVLDDISAAELGAPTIREPGALRALLEGAGALAGGRLSLVVLCTYQSVEVLCEAASGMSLELVILDEAHKTAGASGKRFAVALDESRLKVAKRLCMTATLRVCRPARAGEEGAPSWSMDDPEQYGEIAYRLGFREATRRGIVVPCRVIVSVIDSRDARLKISPNGRVDVDGVELSVREAALRLAVARAVEEYGVTHVISFHASVGAAQRFVEDGPGGIGAFLPGYLTSHVNGLLPAQERATIIAAANAAPRALISNARCLGEGVNCPRCGMVVFADPRQSNIDIVQVAGRAMRVSPGKREGLVLLPLLLNLQADETLEEAIGRSGFASVVDVLSAISMADEGFQVEIANASTAWGQFGRVDDDALKGVDVLGDVEGVSIDVLRRAVVTQALSSLRSAWYVRAGELLGFRVEHERWPSGSASDRIERQLYDWMKRAREARARELLQDEQVALLDTAGFPWDSREATWLEQVDVFLAFRNTEQRYPAESAADEEERILARWVARQRRQRLDGSLSQARQQRLQEIDFQWGNDHRWEGQFLACVEFQRSAGRWPSFGVGATKEELGLAHWAKWQRDSLKAGRLDQERIKRLEQAGFSWTGKGEVDPLDPVWLERLAKLKAFQAQHGRPPSPSAADSAERELSRWLASQRELHSLGRLSAARAERLGEEGVALRVREAGWAAMWAEVLDFRNSTGRWPTNSRAVSAEQQRLGRWVHHQRILARRSQLEADRMATLNGAGFVWNPPVGRPAKNPQSPSQRPAPAQARQPHKARKSRREGKEHA
jgi:superfamily II DNA or RNA helicase